MLSHHLLHGRHSIKSLFFVLREDGTGIGPALPSGALTLSSLVYGIAIRHHVHGRYNLLSRQWVGGGFLIIKPFENTEKYWEVVGKNLKRSIVYHASMHQRLMRSTRVLREKRIDCLLEHDLYTWYIVIISFNSINFQSCNLQQHRSNDLSKTELNFNTANILTVIITRFYLLPNNLGRKASRARPSNCTFGMWRFKFLHSQ